jgi:hypothetical protein
MERGREALKKLNVFASMRPNIHKFPRNTCGVASHPSGELTVKCRGGNHRHLCDDADEPDTAAGQERGSREVRDDDLIRVEECAANACGD